MHVRLLKDWRSWPRGHVFCAMSGGAADVLVRRGLAVVEPEPAKQRDTAAADAGRNQLKKSKR